MGDSFLRTWGVVFLFTATLALAIGVFESSVCDSYGLPRLDDLLYGANLHILLAATLCVGLGLPAPRSTTRRLAARVLGVFLAVEGGIVGGYWIGTIPQFPRFYLTAGRLLTAGAVVGGVLIGVLAARLLTRRLSQAWWDRRARSVAGPFGFGLLVAWVGVNAIVFVASLPSPVQVGVRTDAGERERPDVIVILVDTLRRDHLSYFGYERPTSQELGRLFDQSYVFLNAYTPSTWTTPSVASLFSGLYPTSHGVVTAAHKLPESLPTLAEHLRSYGYRTAGLIANQVLTTSNGFSQGFEFFFPHEPPFWCRHGRTAFERIAKQLTRPGTAGLGWKLNAEARQWLQQTAGQPRFLYIHYMEPHATYEPLPRDREAVAPGAPPGPVNAPFFRDYRHTLGDLDCNDWECLTDPPVMGADELAGMIANYDGEIFCVDRNIGVLLQFLGELDMLDRCHLIFCTDHGEEFFDHRGWLHVNSIYEEMTGAPLAYRPPGGLPAPVPIDRPVSELDLVRTLFTLLEIDPPPLHQGHEIPELLGGEAPSQPLPVLTEAPPHLYSLRHGRWKLIQRGPRNAPEWKLFDLSRDPAELDDLAIAEPDTLRVLCGWLADIVAGNARMLAQPGVITDDPEMLRELRNLGYIK